MELLIARNPDEGSSLPYLLRVPVSGGLVFRARDTWPRTGAVYCHPVPPAEWPEDPEVVERVPLRACARRGAAIDIVADRGREQRSQLVFTRARGRQVVFWQSPRTAKQSRPDVRLPTARAAGLPDLEILVDVHERYPYSFAAQQTATTRRPLRCGDYAVEWDGAVVAAVERKSLADLVSSLTSGRLGYALGELSALGRAAVVIEDRWSRVFALEHVRPAVVADGLAELQLRWPGVPILWCETRKLSEEWTYRYLAAARRWAALDTAASATVDGVSRAVAAGGEVEVMENEKEEEAAAAEAAAAAAGRRLEAPAAPAPTPVTAQIRRWARSRGIEVADRGRLPASVVDAWRDAGTATPTSVGRPPAR